MLSYLFITSIGLTLLALFYFIFLRKETFFQLNRITLLIGLIISIVFPGIEFLNQNQKEIIIDTIPVITLPTLDISVQENIISNTEIIWSDTEIALSIYGAVVLFLLSKFILSNLLLLRFIARNKRTKLNHISVVFTNGKYPTFAYLKYIFWDNSKALNQQEEALILKHEETHVKELHSLDIFLMEFIKIIFWFHPAIYLIDAALRTQHEYLADQKANQMTNDASYRQLMVRSLFEELSISVGHGFQFSTIKSRINMLKQQRSAQWKRVHSIFSIFIVSSIVLIAQACVQDEINAVDPRLQEVTTENIFGYELDEKTYWDINKSIDLEKDFDSDRIASVNVLKNESLPQIFNEKVKGAIIINFKSDLTEEMINKIRQLPSSNHQFQVNTIKNKPEESSPKYKMVDGEKVYIVAQNPAGYPGGMKEFYKLVGKQLVYPKEARKKGIEGRVYLQFIVDKKGNGEHFTIVKGVHPLLDEEVLRIAPLIIKGWTPANTDGEIVKQRIVLPINFKL